MELARTDASKQLITDFIATVPGSERVEVAKELANAIEAIADRIYTSHYPEAEIGECIEAIRRSRSARQRKQ